MNPKNVRRLINFATIVVVILLAAVAIYWYDLGFFQTSMLCRLTLLASE